METVRVPLEQLAIVLDYFRKANWPDTRVGNAAHDLASHLIPSAAESGETPQRHSPAWYAWVDARIAITSKLETLLAESEAKVAELSLALADGKDAQERVRLRNRVESLRGLCKTAVGYLRDEGAEGEAQEIADLIGGMEAPLPAAPDSGQAGE